MRGEKVRSGGGGGSYCSCSSVAAVGFLFFSPKTGPQVQEVRHGGLREPDLGRVGAGTCRTRGLSGSRRRTSKAGYLSVTSRSKARCPSRPAGEGGPEGGEAGLDLSPRPLRAVAGALARRPCPLQPLGLRPQALRPLEERGVGFGVLPDRRGRPRAQRGVVRRSGILPAAALEEAAKRALEGAPGRSAAQGA